MTNKELLDQISDDQLLAISRAENIWRGMLSRCTSKSNSCYPNYGGRGILMDSGWKKSFIKFIRDVGLPPTGKSIERNDNDGNYCKENCRWATKVEQIRNRRITVFTTIKGQRKPLVQWAEEYGVNAETMRARIRYGFTPEQALNLAPRTNPLTTELTYDGVTLPFKAMARKHGLSVVCLHKRLESGMSLKDAITKPIEKRGGKVSLKLVTLNGEEGTIKSFAKKHGINHTKVYLRLGIGWTLEEALEITPRSPRKAWNKPKLV